jgi:hypothetical protein
MLTGKRQFFSQYLYELQAMSCELRVTSQQSN